MANASRPGGAGVRELAPKRSWGRVLFKTCIVLVLMVIGSHWGWGKYAGARLERELARYRAAGEPIDPADFVEPQPPEDQNAAIDLIAAADLIDGRSKIWRRFDRLEPALPLDDREMRVIGEVLSASRDSIRRVDAAMTRPHIHWKQTFQSPVVLAPEPWQSSSGNLRELFRAAALRSHQFGDDRDALGHIRRLLFIARAVDRDPSLDAHHYACLVRETACDALIQIASDLEVNSGESAAAVQGIINELTDDFAHVSTFVRALQGERMRSSDLLLAYTRGNYDLIAVSDETNFERGTRRVALTPFVLNDGPIILEHASRLVAAARRASNWPGLRADMPDCDQPDDFRIHPRLHIFSLMTFHRYAHRLPQHFQALTAQRLAATALAIRLFAADHDGRIPIQLDDLVPSYLPAVPIDPMANGGRRLGFIPAATVPILYSVGIDGIDNGGNAQPIHERNYVDPSALKWDAHDLVIHLVRQARMTRENLDD